jgi:hypothetical protein
MHDASSSFGLHIETEDDQHLTLELAKKIIFKSGPAKAIYFEHLRVHLSQQNLRLK